MSFEGVRIPFFIISQADVVAAEPPDPEAAAPDPEAAPDAGPPTLTRADPVRSPLVSLLFWPVG